jgi:hypothetical protein
MIYNLNDLNLTDEQLLRIANGEDIQAVIASANPSASTSNPTKPE